MSDEFWGAAFTIFVPLILAGLLLWAHKKMKASPAGAPDTKTHRGARVVFLVIAIGIGLPAFAFFLMMFAMGIMSGVAGTP